MGSARCETLDDATPAVVHPDALGQRKGHITTPAHADAACAALLLIALLIAPLVAAGVENAGLGNLHNAKRALAPVVNIVGEMATWHQAADPLLAMNIQQVCLMPSPTLPHNSPLRRAGETRAELRLSLQMCMRAKAHGVRLNEQRVANEHEPGESYARHATKQLGTIRPVFAANGRCPPADGGVR